MVWAVATTNFPRQGLTFLTYFYRSERVPTTGAVVRHSLLGLRAFHWQDKERWVDVTEAQYELLGYPNEAMARERVELIDALES